MPNPQPTDFIYEKEGGYKVKKKSQMRLKYSRSINDTEVQIIKSYES